jgi:orotate phosphoribosyltransferase
MSNSLLSTLHVQRGHFVYESGHHGDLWIDLDPLFLRPVQTRDWARDLAEIVRTWGADVVCGPMSGGALLAQMIALVLEVDFVSAERIAAQGGGVRYHLPAGLRHTVADRRVLVVDDAINAGSALAQTLTELDRWGAISVGVASLLTMGPAAAEIAADRDLPFGTLATLERGMWTPTECPLCAQGVALDIVHSG